MSTAQAFPPSRDAALARLADFVPRAGHLYAQLRNEDRGPTDRSNISLLSPYLRHRMLGEDEVLAAVLKEHSPAQAEKFMQEVFWRTYWKGWLQLRPAIWTRYLAELEEARTALAGNGGLRKAYGEAVEGRTGIDCFDAWIGELAETGYLHNHARMWFASIWIFTLRLPWQLGADLFYRQLLDADPASNTLSWRWVGGLQTIGKTYLARPDNISRFTGGRFSPRGLATEAVPLVDPQPIPGPGRLAYCATEAPAGPCLLLVTEENLNPDTTSFAEAEIKGAALADIPLADAPITAAVTAFRERARKDASARLEGVLGMAVADAIELDVPNLLALTQYKKVSRVITMEPAIGPVATALEAAKPELAQAGVTLTYLRHPLDALAWPHAARGFFHFREQIGDIVARLGLVNGGQLGFDLPAARNAHRTGRRS
ncbi:MAG: FAD-binding domain-containing protein [Bosea sp. (in: a-proteobacteria)]